MCLFSFKSLSATDIANHPYTKLWNLILTVFHHLFFPISAVKFGRMSKKQREKVEDEVRFHRAQMRAQSDAAPDSSVFDTQTPSSSDQLHHSYNG